MYCICRRNISFYYILFYVLYMYIYVYCIYEYFLLFPSRQKKCCSEGLHVTPFSSTTGRRASYLVSLPSVCCYQVLPSCLLGSVRTDFLPRVVCVLGDISCLGHFPSSASPMSKRQQSGKRQKPERNEWTDHVGASFLHWCDSSPLGGLAG